MYIGTGIAGPNALVVTFWSDGVLVGRANGPYTASGDFIYGSFSGYLKNVPMTGSISGPINGTIMGNISSSDFVGGFSAQPTSSALEYSGQFATFGIIGLSGFICLTLLS
jgi:hypothetical protein